MTLKENWESFEAEVLDKDAPAIQRSEMKIAFYAGVASTIGVLTDSNLSEDEAEELLFKLKNELHEYIEEYKQLQGITE